MSLRLEIALSVIFPLFIALFMPHYFELNRVLLLWLPIIAALTAWELYTNDQTILAYSHDLQTCNHNLDVTLQKGVVQAHKHSHHMAAVKANLRDCLEERDVLRRNEKDCDARSKAHEESVQWIDKMVSGMKGQMKEEVCAVWEEEEGEKEGEAEAEAGGEGDAEGDKAE